MEIPYSIEVYRAAMESYVTGWGLVGPLLWCLSVGVLVAAWLPSPKAADKLALISLGALAIWVGWTQQLEVMASYNFMAPLYGWAWIVQGAALALAASFGSLHLAKGKAASWGLSIASVGVVFYPLAAILDGASGAGADWPGMSSDPTAILLFGLLVMMRGGAAWLFWPFALAWAGVASMTGYLLETWPLYLVPLCAILALFGRVWSR